MLTINQPSTQQEKLTVSWLSQQFMTVSLQSLPTESVDTTEHQKKHKRQSTRGNILIVDDTLPSLKLLSNMLTAQNYKVRGVSHAPTALTAVRLAPPDLILLDINMPEMNGYEVCRRLKEDPHTADIPIIFISAMDEVLDKVRAFSIGGVDYITKPFQVEEVLVRVETHLTMRNLQKSLEIANTELKRQVMLDGLTQVANRRRFDEYLKQEWQQAARHQHPLALLLCDVDYFKLYNDSYGHQAGDDCLKKIAKAMQMSVNRAEDLVARYGGEEFALILPNTSTQTALEIAEQIQTLIAELKIVHDASRVSEYVTLSMGLCSCIPPLPVQTCDQLFKQADDALYAAKHGGRNRVVVSSPDCQ